MHTHGSVPAFLSQVAHLVSDLPHATYLAETPQQIFYALLLRATCHAVQGRGEQRVARTLRTLRSGRVEAWFGSPRTWSPWLQAGLPVPETLRTVLLGAAPVTRPFLRRLLDVLPPRTTAHCIYRLTEVGPVCPVDAAHNAHWTGSGDLVGPPLTDVEVRVTDAGVVEVRSPSLAPRALRGRALGPWLDTGDLRSLEPAGLSLHRPHRGLPGAHLPGRPGARRRRSALRGAGGRSRRQRWTAFTRRSDGGASTRWRDDRSIPSPHVHRRATATTWPSSG